MQDLLLGWFAFNQFFHKIESIKKNIINQAAMQDLLLGWFAFNQFFQKIESIKKKSKPLGW